MLYESFYDLDREPFSLSPDPAFLFLAPSHAEASAQLLYAVRSRKGFAVLTGEAGTGKTTLLRALLDSVGPDVRTAYVLNPPRTRGELYAALASEFGLRLDGQGTWPVSLQRFLLDAYEHGVTAVALFDEAQNVPPDVLEEIRLLTNLETANTKLLQVVLAGQPELDSILDTSAMRALRQRVVLRQRLSPLGSWETVQYIASRMRVAGADLLPFEGEACLAIYRYSGGIPRLINVLCDNSLLTGYAANTKVIDCRIVDSVARDACLIGTNLSLAKLRLPGLGDAGVGPRRAGFRAAVAATGAAVVVAISLAAFYRAYPERLRTFLDRVESLVGATVNSLGQRMPGMINRSAVYRNLPGS